MNYGFKSVAAEIKKLIEVIEEPEKDDDLEVEEFYFYVRKGIIEGQNLVIQTFQEQKLTWIKESTIPKVNWKFMPPRAPHFGGLHEAAVKTVKTHLKKVLRWKHN